MIRLINPLLHTKYLDMRAIRSVYLWWTEQPTIDKHKAFLQFEAWRAHEKGADTHFGIIWKYPCFHLARGDMDQILKQAPWITPHVCKYQPEPTRTMMPYTSAFATLNSLFPKNFL